MGLQGKAALVGAAQYKPEKYSTAPRMFHLEQVADLTLQALDDAGLSHALGLSQRLRAAGLNVETQLEPRKLAKQLQYADKAGIRFVVMHGEDEAARGVVAVKDLRRGEQFEVSEAELASTLLVEREQLRTTGGAR